ncbi:hypothetical protein [Paenibacillus koleovorans]|uniref:hypothetical protein n=1 Tax=Paenibacillus koleovorans TaxID=121608 RepID=UPI000FDAE384|nr:hypothetical protein [Paenibacillus koleovorans]
MKKITSIILLLLLTLSFITPTYAADYNYQFSQYSGTGSYATARSPYHVGNTDLGADDFSLPTHRINGPNNQPRYLQRFDLTWYSDVHNGTDLKANAGVPLYPMFNCYIAAVVQPSSGNNGYVTCNYDINNDGIYDNYYVKYMHSLPLTGLAVGHTKTPTQSIGQVDTGSTWPAHTHLQHTDSTSSKTWSLFPFFRSVLNWGYGYYMEYMAGDTTVSGTLYISANSMDEGTNAGPGSIEYYYKVGSGGTWQKGSNMSLYLTGDSSGNYYRYSLDLKAAAGNPGSGSTIYYYLAAIRTNGTISSSYDWGLWPAYYKMPDKTPATIIASGYTPVTSFYTVP